MQFLAWDQRNRRIPWIVTRLLMRLAARRSPLLRKMLVSDNEYLDSISTYKLKLGADHLPPDLDGPMARKVSAAPHMALVRLHAADRPTARGGAPRTPRRRTGRAVASRQHRGRAGAR